jgi:TonB family protein
MLRTVPAILVAIAFSLVAGCATGDARSARREKGPFPAEIKFAGGFDQKPVPLVIPRAVYPPLLVEQRIPGSAIVSFKTGPSGFVTEAAVDSATEPAFGASALSAVAKMEFSPATRSGVGVPFTGTAIFEFALQ